VIYMCIGSDRGSCLDRASGSMCDIDMYSGSGTAISSASDRDPYSDMGSDIAMYSDRIGVVW